MRARRPGAAAGPGAVAGHGAARSLAACLVAAAGLALSAGAGAQTAPAESAPAPSAAGRDTLRPWASGVSEERQRSAEERFREGNVLLKESLFVQAGEKYRRALEEWDHPGIHYNLALALMNLDQPLEVREHLLSALRYGPSPLDAEKFEHAKSYLVLVEKQLARVAVSCEEEGAAVSLDGKLLFRAPGKYDGLVRPGPHTIAATKEGLKTTERTKILLPGEPTLFHLKLFTANELIAYRHRWPMWQPIAVSAVGAGLLLAGGILTVQSKNRFEEYDRRIDGDPTCRSGCQPSGDLLDVKSQGERLRTTAAVSFVAGGAVLAGGIVFFVLNRSVPYRLEPSERQDAATVVPLVGPNMAGVVGTARF